MRLLSALVSGFTRRNQRAQGTGHRSQGTGPASLLCGALEGEVVQAIHATTLRCTSVCVGLSFSILPFPPTILFFLLYTCIFFFFFPSMSCSCFPLCVCLSLLLVSRYHLVMMCSGRIYCEEGIIISRLPTMDDTSPLTCIRVSATVARGK